MTSLPVRCLLGLFAVLIAVSSTTSAQTILREVYTNITGSSIANLTTSTNFPYFPNLRTSLTNFEAPVNFGDAYGTRLRGYLLPPASGNYLLWIASDDQSELYLSPNELPENKRLIAWVSSNTSSRQWTKQTNQQSAPIPLQAGQRYYVEALHKEGAGGDNLAVGWQLPDGTLERPIPGNRLQPWVISTNRPSIQAQPQNLSVSDDDTATFFVSAIGAEPLTYQWQRDGLSLDRETSPLLFLDAISLADHGALFQCVISNLLGSITSRVATLTVYAETNPPMVTVLNPPPGSTVRQLSQVEVTFSEPVQGITAGDLLVNGQPATNVMGVAPGPFTFQFAAQPAGPALLEWAMGHDIRDYSLATNAFSGGSWNNTVDPAFALPEVIITEFLAANENGLRDEDGEFQDWIELQNRSATPVNLAGWSLSDDPDLPGKWVLPSRWVAPGAFLVVFASGKDRKPPGTNALHTNFKLSPSGEFLGLFTPEVPRVPASQTGDDGYPEQRNDCSYGLDAAGQWRYFAPPTPGATNGLSTITGIVDPVRVNIPRGLFNRPFGVTLSTRTPGAQIRFTRDGSEPTLSNGFVYTVPVMLSNTTVLRAAAFKTDHLPSRTSTHSYFFGLTPALQSLPVLSLVTDTNHLIGPRGIIGIGGGYYSNSVWYPQTTNDYHNPRQHGIAWERPVSAELIHPAGNPGFQADCGIRVQGGNSIRPRYTPTSKFSFRLYFRGDYGPTLLEYPLMTNIAVTAFDEIVLRAGMNDPVNPFIRDELVRRLGHDTGRVDPMGTFVNLFINGEYKGYYNPVERVGSGFLQAHHGGDEDWDVITVGSQVQEGDAIEWNSLRAFVSAADTTQASVYQQIELRLDLTNFVDYLLLKNCSGGGDWPHNNWRSGRQRTADGIFRYYVWDAEWAWGYGSRLPSLNLFTNELIGTTEVATFFKRLRPSPEFRLLWADRAHKHYYNGGALTDQNILRHHDELSNILSGVITNFNATIANNWVPARRPHVIAQMIQEGLLASSNAPVFSQHGGRLAPGWPLSMTNLAGTIWYTTNGRDPRLRFTGTVAPDAQAWSNGMTLPLFTSTLIKARSLAGTHWSAVTEAAFTVGLLGVPLQITEVMYHPAGGNAFEYVELRNLGAAPVDVSGFKFSGISFQFPTPSIIAGGATILLASDADPAAFAARYPGVLVSGRFSGSLDNGGERLVLLDRDGNIVTSLDYDDQDGWPSAADGSGRSLQMINLFGAPDDPANWQASPQPAGSPGIADQLAAPLPGARLSEVAALNTRSVANGTNFPDWVELHNPGPDAVDLAGWSLTDDSNERKFVFPAGTLLGPNGFLVVWCDNATNAPGLHTGFALDQAEERVFLFNAQTARVDAISFGRQLADYTISQIRAEWRLSFPTPGAPNLAAPTATSTNLVINEWLANPLPGGNDWLELYNHHATEPAALRGLYLGNGTAVDQLHSLSFIPPHGFALLICDQNPGSGHLDLKLPAAGSPLVLFDPAGAEIHRVANAAQSEGVSRGFTPDGSSTLADFPGEATPGAPNVSLAVPGVVFTEVLAVNVSAVANALGRTADFFEVGNITATNLNLAGIGVSVNNSLAPQWRFPAGVILPPGGRVAVWCDPEQPPSTNSGLALNFGRELPDRSGTLALFAASGRLLVTLAYGPQAANCPVGLFNNTWRMLNAPTPGAPNASPAALGSTGLLRLNEWMAGDGSGNDWFELVNLGSLPVDLSGLYLTDDPSLTGLTKFRIPPLSFIGPNGFVQYEADGDAAQGAYHVNFKLDADGAALLLLSAGQSLLDAVWIGAAEPGVSEGRVPDGADNLVAFPATASPGYSNWRPIPRLLINELLANTSPPWEDAIELLNASSNTVHLGGWFLSDQRDQLCKYRIPVGTALTPGGFAVFYENQFGTGSNAFMLDAVRGGELWLSEADALGKLTGLRTRVEFGAAAPGVSWGWVATSQGADFAPLSACTFGVDAPLKLAEFRSGTGQANAGPLVNPVVINELMYHAPAPANGLPEEEFIELANASAHAVSLFDPLHPTNTWQLRHAVEFSFPANVTLNPGEFVLVVSFDPVADPDRLAAFQARHRIGSGIRVFGPFQGRLANEGESVELYRPDKPQPAGAPAAGMVPWLLVERVSYGIEFPWPGHSANGNGSSLQRRSRELYSNEPFNWGAALPTPGAPNAVSANQPPAITRQPTNTTNWEGTGTELTVSATGEVPLVYQWRHAGVALPGQTNASLIFPSLTLAHAGDYDVVIANSGGVTQSAPATIKVLAPPRFTLLPGHQTVASNATVILQAQAIGTEPLHYQWSFNGALLPGAAGPSLVISNANYDDIGTYQVTVWNEAGATNASANVLVLIRPLFLQQPQSHVALEGQTVTLSLAVTGAPPFGFRWRHNGRTIVPFESGGPTLTFASVCLTNAGNYYVVVTNLALPSGAPSANAQLTVLADFDRDRQADLWEAHYSLNTNDAADALLDHDGDTLANLQEYIAGTDPRNAQDCLKVDFLQPAGADSTVLQYRAISNRSYTIQQAEPLLPAVWSNVANLSPRPTNWIANWTNAAPPGPRFYRIVTP